MKSVTFRLMCTGRLVAQKEDGFATVETAIRIFPGTLYGHKFDNEEQIQKDYEEWLIEQTRSGWWFNEE